MKGPANKSSGILWVSFAVVLAAGAAAYGLDRFGLIGRTAGEGAAAGAPAAAASPPAGVLGAMAQSAVTAPVPVAQPKVQNVSDTLEVTGNAASIAEVKLLARVVGYLEKIHFEDGAMVKKNDLLFTVQQDQYKAQLQQAQAQVALAQAQIDHAKIEVVRYANLVKKGAATQVEVDNWNFQLQSGKANLMAAEAAVTLAKINLGYTEIRAPFDGQMGKHLVDPGNVVGGNGQQGALAVINQLDPIYVEANLSAQQAAQIRANMTQRQLTLAQIQQIPIEVAVGNEKTFSHRGTLQYVSPAIDPATGTLYLRGTVRNPDRHLLPGAFVRLRLPMEKTAQNALLVPNNALQEDQGGRYVLVLDKNNVTQQRYVQIGQQVGTLRVVTGGLSADDLVVIGELWRSSPGTKVTPQLKTIDG
jgi:RND family efflux transporter MFP subunit